MSSTPALHAVQPGAARGHRTPWVTRSVYAVLSVVLVGFLVTELVLSPSTAKNRSQLWAPLLAGVLPDIALLFGVGRHLERGQIHPRAVAS